MAEQRKSTELAAFLAGTDDSDDRAAAWQAYACGSSSELAEGVQETREVLHGGTPAEVIALAGVDIQTKARAAAAAFTPEEPLPPEAA